MMQRYEYWIGPLDEGYGPTEKFNGKIMFFITPLLCCEIKRLLSSFEH
jgi:hypothetical protein